MIIGIYVIKNTITGKVYVGSSVDMAHRFAEHKCDLNHNRHQNVYLQRAWNKYGRDLFIFSLLEVCPTNDLIQVEQKWIDLLKASNKMFGYNIRPKADSRHSLSSETKFKISQSKKGQPSWNRGIKTGSEPQETREKKRLAALGRWQNPIYRAMMLSKMGGKIISFEQREKLRESNKKTWEDPAKRLAHGKLLAGIWASRKRQEVLV